MKKILSLILTLLVSITGMTCLTYAAVEDYKYTNLRYILTGITVVQDPNKTGPLSYGYQITFQPESGKAMPSTIKIEVEDETEPLIQCTTTGFPSGCSYTYHRKVSDGNGYLLIYKDLKDKSKEITITASALEYTGEVNYSILDGNKNVNDLFYNVGNNDYVIHDGEGNYTNTFGIFTTGLGYVNYGMYQLPATIEVKLGDETEPLKMCQGDATLGSDGCDYTYNDDRDPDSVNIFGTKQKGALVVAKKHVDENMTIKVTINLNRIERKVTGIIENGYFNGDTSKTGNVELNKICKADYYIDKNYKYTVQINANANYELPDTITVSGLSNTTEHPTWKEFADGFDYNYDKNTGKVTFNSSVFDYYSEFKIDAGTLKEEEKKTSIVTCEDANGKGWIWSESKKACVYKVSNTSTKG